MSTNPKRPRDSNQLAKYVIELAICEVPVETPETEMAMRRFTRLTNAFSKKVENHAYAVALHMMYYNFVRIHKTLRMTPAMAAGVSARLWEISDIVALVEAQEATKDRKRGTYKKAV